MSRSGPDACPQALDLPGRWNQGYAFTASCKVDYLMRARMSDQLAGVALVERQRSADAPDHAPMRRSYAADQGEVWAEISAKEARIGVHSRTSALHDLYEREAIDLGRWFGRSGEWWSARRRRGGGGRRAVSRRGVRRPAGRHADPRGALVANGHPVHLELFRVEA